MWKLFNGIVLVCAVANGIRDSVHWYNGEPATGFVWFFAILFSVSVAVDCLKEVVK